MEQIHLKLKHSVLLTTVDDNIYEAITLLEQQLKEANELLSSTQRVAFTLGQEKLEAQKLGGEVVAEFEDTAIKFTKVTYLSSAFSYFQEENIKTKLENGKHFKVLVIKQGD